MDNIHGVNYKKEFSRGVKWNTVRMITATAVQLITILLVGLYIRPEDYGLYGIANIFIGLAYVFSDAGFSNAIIFKQENNNDKLSSLYFTNIIIGFFIFIVMCALSPVAASYFNNSNIIKLIALSAVNFIIIPFGQIYISLARKDLEFKKISIIDSTSNFLQLVSVILMLINGVGVLALIYCRIIQSLVSSLLYVISKNKKYKFSIAFSLKGIKEFVNFGLYQLGERITTYLKANVDYILIGRFLGPRELGIYTLAYQLVMIPLQRINPILTDTAFPLLARFKNDNKKLNYEYYKILRIIGYIVFPILTGIFVLAPEFIGVFYGSEWAQSVIIIRIYCIIGIIGALGNPIGCILMAKGRPDIGFKWNLTAVFGMLIFEYIGIKSYGLLGITIATTIFVILVSWPADFIIRGALTGMKVKEYFKNLGKPSLIVAIMLSLLMISKLLLNRLISGDLALMILISIMGSISYVILFIKLERERYIYLKSKILRGSFNNRR